MKITEAKMNDIHDQKEYHYIFYDLAIHRDAEKTIHAISKTYYFISEGTFYKQHEMLQEALSGKDYKNQASAIDHIANLNRVQLKLAEIKRDQLINMHSLAPKSDRISDLIHFHDGVMGLLLEWYNTHNLSKDKNHQDKEVNNDALWAIADDMRGRKKAGEFDTFRDAYRWAEKNLSKKGLTITAHKLEREYHKAKSIGKVGDAKNYTASIPFMITRKQRLELKALGVSESQIKEMKPEEAQSILNDQ